MPSATRFEETDDLENSKICTICKKRLSYEAFHKNKSKKDGLQTRCRNCYRDWYNQRYQSNPEFREKRKQHFSKFYEEKYPSRREQHSNARLLYKYGLTVEDFEKLSIAQDHLCAICRQPPRGKKRLSVDHCHETMAIRGLLCDPCNTGLGMFREDPMLLHSAIAYLTSGGDNDVGTLLSPDIGDAF